MGILQPQIHPPFGPKGRRQARRAKSTVRPVVTRLEDRLAPATLHWLGSSAGNGNLWSVATNWLEHQAPLSGDRLVFDTTTPGFSATTNGFAPSNDLSGLTNLAIGINDSSAAGDFTISGNTFGLVTTAGIGITSTLSVGTTATINNNITLGANTTVAVGLGSLTLGGLVGGGFSLTDAGSPASTLTLNSANTYSGGTVLTSGAVSVNTDTSLGTGTITFNGGTLSDATSFLKLPNAFTVSAPSTIGGGGFFKLDGDGTLNATLSLANTGFLTLNGALSGPSGLSEIGFPGGTTLGGTTPNTFTGGTSIVFGGITLQKTAGVNALVSPISLVGADTSLTLGASNQINNSTSVYLGLGSSFNTNGFSDSVTALTGLGSLDTASTATAGLTVTGGGSQVLTGAVLGSGLLTYNGTGSLTLAGASSSYSGTLTAAGGALVVSADFSAASAKVTGGTLDGTGVVKSIAATSGFVDPATAGTAGVLNTAASAVALSLSGATFRADLAAQGPSDHIALGSNATLNLNGANLAVNAIGTTFANSYQIITSPTGGLSGAFNSFANGSTITAGSQSFRVNYTAFAVTLTNLAAGSKTLHWTGATSSNWSAAGNWEENLAPASGDTLVFDTSTPGFAATAASYAPSNDLNGLTNIALVINDAPGSGNFTIGGNNLGLVTTAGIGISSTLATGTAATINNVLTLGANTTVNVGLGSLTLAGPVSGGFSLTEAGSPVGTLLLSNSNSYTGGTFLTSGTVSVGADTSLGVGTIHLSGGTLASSVSFLHVANSFVVSALSAIGGGGFLNVDGNGILNANLRLTNTGFLTLDGAISGSGGLIEDGFPGNTTLAGGVANTYTGPTTIIGGTLELNKSPGVNAVVSPISLAGGSFPTLSWSASSQLNGGASVTLGTDSTLSTGGFSDTIASLSGSGTVSDTTNTGGTGLTVSGSGAMLLTGPVTGNGLLTYNGTGSLTLGGTSSLFTGQLIAAGGSLLVLADFSGATALTRGSGTLGGSGIVKTLAASSTSG